MSLGVFGCEVEVWVKVCPPPFRQDLSPLASILTLLTFGHLFPSFKKYLEQKQVA